MIRKMVMIGLVVMLLISLGGVIGCGKVSIPGTYVNEDNPSEYLELNEDGTFYLKEMGLDFSGEWEVKGNELRLHWMGMVVTGEVKGNKIYDEQGKVWVKQSKPSEEETLAPPEPTTPAATLEVANFNLSELLELREAIEQFITSARLIANEEERQLLSQANVVLAAIQSNSNLHNIVAEKTEERQLVLDILGGIFSVGVQHFYNIPSLVASAMTKGAEELGNRIAEWQVLGYLSLATVTQPDSGVMEVVYHKEQGEIWANFNIYDPVGRVCMYIRVEPALVSFEGGGNILLSEGVKPVTGKCRIAYHFGEVSAPALPLSPDEVVIRFFTLFAKGQYSEAEKLATPEWLDYAYFNGLGEALGDRNIIEVEITSLMIEKEREYDPTTGGWAIHFEDVTGEEIEADFVKVSYVLHLDDGSEEIDSDYLIRIDNKWKLSCGPPWPAEEEAPAEADQEVTFPDPNLEAAIREAIDKPEGPIYISELEGLSSLSASERNITDLTGLEYCTHLTELMLYDNQISDISPLASLTNLTYLVLTRNQISDISPLSSLTNLTGLDLAGNQISDISPLSCLTNLTGRLNLSYNEISDIALLASFTNITGLHLGANQISDISPLSSLTNLTSLTLEKNQISNISSLASLSNLTHLRLNDNHISDISPLVKNSGLSDGDYVDLMNNPLSNESLDTYIPQLEERGVEVFLRNT